MICIAGNRKCLETDPKARGIDVRTKLLELHAKWYSSNIMYLVVLGKGKPYLRRIFVPRERNRITRYVWAEEFRILC